MTTAAEPVEPTNDIAVLERWIGREQVVEEVIDPVAVRRLELTLDRQPSLGRGDPLPPMWHTIAFADVVAHHDLGPDGHPKRGGFLPPVALPRRMWAGSRIEFHAPLLIGESARRTSTIQNVAIKEGASGTLCFVTVEHVTESSAQPSMTEHQDLVYRADPAADAPRPDPKPAPTDATVSETVTPSEVQLFRYSAVTFNGHRIHYDRTYARDVEGYDGLVVHGPFTAALLADLAVRTSGPLGSFSFRGTAPLLDTAPFTIHARPDEDGTELWATTPAGGLAMTARATRS